MSHDSGAAGVQLSPLPWESSHFGIPMGRICSTGLTKDSLEASLQEASRRGYRLVEAVCAVGDAGTLRLFEEHGFRMTGARSILGKSIRAAVDSSAQTLRKANNEDIPALQALFIGIFKDSRFYQYPEVPSAKVLQLYQIWLKKGVLGQFDDECLLLEEDTVVLAFACMKYHTDHASIGLFGVNPARTRQGLGSRLLSGLEASLLRKGIRAISVATQANNFSAVGLYEKAGFRTTALDIYLLRQLS